MPFMGGAMGGGGQRQQPSQRFWATPPDLPSAPTIDDALYAVEKMSGQGMFRFGHGSGVDDHSQAVYQVFDQLQNQYKEKVAGMLGVQKNNVDQAGQLNAQQSELAGQQSQSAGQAANVDLMRARAENLRGTAGQGAGALDDNTLDQLAKYWGQTGTLPQGMARNKNLIPQILNRASKLGITADDAVAGKVGMAGKLGGARTLGSLEANIGTFASTAEGAIDLARKASSAVPRGSFVPWTKLQQMSETQMSDPNLAAFKASLTAVRNEYANAINPKGKATDSDKKTADDNLSVAQSPEALDAVLTMMQKEVERSKSKIGEAAGAWGAHGKSEGKPATAAPKNKDSSGKTGGPPPEAVKMLKSGKGTAAQFDAIFGQGAAARAMGQ